MFSNGLVLRGDGLPQRELTCGFHRPRPASRSKTHEASAALFFRQRRRRRPPRGDSRPPADPGRALCPGFGRAGSFITGRLAPLVSSIPSAARHLTDVSSPERVTLCFTPRRPQMCRHGNSVNLGSRRKRALPSSLITPCCFPVREEEAATRSLGCCTLPHGPEAEGPDEAPVGAWGSPQRPSLPLLSGTQATRRGPRAPPRPSLCPDDVPRLSDALLDGGGGHQGDR